MCITNTPFVYLLYIDVLVKNHYFYEICQLLCQDIKLSTTLILQNTSRKVTISNQFIFLKFLVKGYPNPFYILYQIPNTFFLSEFDNI